MLKAFKYRIYPTDSQKVLINKHIGACRFVYNLALETRQMAWVGSRKNLTCFDLNKQITDLKMVCPWLKEVNSQSLQAPIRHLDNGFTAFFKGRGNFPKFKKKSNRGSFYIQQNIKLSEHKIVIPKFQEGISIVLHRPIKGTIKQATVSKTPTNKYFISILCETGELVPDKPIITENKTVGIDLGIKSFLTTSDSEEVENPKFLKKSISKLKYVQRKYSKHKGKRTKLRLAKLHEKVTNQRKNFHHVVSSNLVKNHDSIALETLKVSNMVKNHNLAQSISDAGWSSFVTMLEYKSEWYGTNILKIGTFEPSSKTCSKCGSIKKDLQLSQRTWECSNCGTSHHRDVNAAVNIKNFALRNYLSGTDRKNHSELPTLVGVLTCETRRKVG